MSMANSIVSCVRNVKSSTGAEYWIVDGNMIFTFGADSEDVIVVDILPDAISFMSFYVVVGD